LAYLQSGSPKFICWSQKICRKGNVCVRMYVFCCYVQYTAICL